MVSTSWNIKTKVILKIYAQNLETIGAGKEMSSLWHSKNQNVYQTTEFILFLLDTF